MKKMTKAQLKDMGIERYIIKPSLSFMGGIIVTKDTTFEDRETAKHKNEQSKAKKYDVIEQKLENFILTTKLTEKFESPGFNWNSIKTTTEDLSLAKKETIALVFIPGQGWGIPDQSICTPEKAREDLKILENKED